MKLRLNQAKHWRWYEDGKSCWWHKLAKVVYTCKHVNKKIILHTKQEQHSIQNKSHGTYFLNH